MPMARQTHYVLEEVAAPVPRAGQALITVRAAGVNFVDALCMQGTYQIKPALPFIPGMEVAGIVSAVADGVSAVAVGDRVACLAGIGGGFAEQVAVAADRLVRIPDAHGFRHRRGVHADLLHVTLCAGKSRALAAR